MTAATGMRRVAVRVEGVVQGVGFRPYVFRLAEELGLAGFVLNDVHGVLAEVEGEPAAVARFVARLPAAAPPLARVEAVAVRELEPAGERAFAIVESVGGGVPDALVSPDTATCADCLAELADPRDRRHRYPFVNCTNCGPRFTIVRDVPYDRPATTMAAFEMCDACQAEYDDPRDRRFHAQPNACPVCGPRVRLVPSWPVVAMRPRSRTTGDALAETAALLAAGGIVAVKGLGGYHLACRADDARAVAALRARKHREDKPFALMVGDLAAARELVELDAVEEEALLSPARPIVLARRRERPASPIAPAVAPGARELGVMLPYTPLHHVLLADTGCPLVMTSGNVSDEPIAYRDDDARERLSAIADAFLVHDRPIHVRTDDSVVRVVRGRERLLRRSRGFVPERLPLPVQAARPLLACGADLKSTFCVAKAARAWVGHHIGDLADAETLRSYGEGIDRFERLFAVRPEVVAHDLHPDYRSTAYALAREQLDGVELVGVQHHHAHLAACLAEHGETGIAVGAIYDGTGAGTDGTVWGGELLVGDLHGFTRVAHLVSVRLPGGDAAAREPWRMACAWLVAAESAPADPTEAPPIPPSLAGRVDPARWRAVARLARGGVAAPVTTSVGRLFDAVAALCGVGAAVGVTYEGQAAVQLEALADRAERGTYALALTGDLLDPHATIASVQADLAAGRQPARAAMRFHRALAEATATACERAARRAGTERVVLSGGVFQNRLLLDLTADRLERAGLRLLLPERLPPNDGGVAYGQAAIAAARDA